MFYALANVPTVEAKRSGEQKLKTKGRDPAFIDVPERTLFGSYGSLAAEFIPRGLYTAENISPSSPLKFNWNCAVCKALIKNVSVSSRTSAIDQARGTRGCPVCAKRSPGQREPGVLLSEWMRAECREEPGSALTPRDRLLTDSRELRCWCCHKCWFVFSATVAARNAKKDPQQCPNCSKFSKGELVDLTDKRYVRIAKLFVRDPRNTGYVQLRKKLPILHRVYWECSKGHNRYTSFSEVSSCSGLRSSEPRIGIIRDFWRKLIETISGGWCTLIETGRTLIETDTN